MTEPLMIATEPSVDGSTYVATVTLGYDDVLVLDREQASIYAWAVVEAVELAEYDAAVLGQLVAKGGDRDMARLLVGELRSDRPPLDQAVMAPMTITPGVNERQVPFLAVRVRDRAVGQITPADARTHALNVLGAVAVADLDAGYLRLLRGSVGLAEGTARHVVGDLVDWRDRGDLL